MNVPSRMVYWALHGYRLRTHLPWLWQLFQNRLPPVLPGESGPGTVKLAGLAESACKNSALGLFMSLSLFITQCTTTDHAILLTEALSSRDGNWLRCSPMSS